MNKAVRKIRRLWITYVGWHKWSGMWGRFVLGHAFQGQQTNGTLLVTDDVSGDVEERLTTSFEWMQQVDYASFAPRVFADREALLSFVKVLDEYGGGSGVVTAYGQPELTPELAVANILETPTDQLTKISLSVGLPPATTVTMHSSPGWDENLKSDPRDSLNGMNVHDYGGVHCVRIVGMKFHTGDRMYQDLGRVVDALRRYTTDPSKVQLRKLKGDFPLVNEDSRQTVREQKFQAGVQKRAAWIGAGAAVVVTVLAEVIKAIAGSPS
ncbi:MULTISPECIES: hypothetical protein [Micrococcaceae]|uniref:hypothetical protein n=1 Tax=Micrococcaceae TaxID=1268 RepID=UPI0006F7604D|nr:hypothetical protein [Arthrobacter sp. Soil761]KRE65413.1 hypothetical protein ASG79_13640 [Arthrobacter sp. Soil761]